MSRRCTVGRWVGQAVLYAAFAAFLGLLSDWPVYTPHDPDKALIKLSLSHPGQRKEECRRRSLEELAKLAPNMRAPLACSRERWPVVVELDLDGERIFARTVNPAGLSADGQSSFYSTFAVPAGRHRIAVQRLLISYGFTKVMKDLYESTLITETALTRLKRDLDRATDSYDSIRVYQYPMQDTLVITSLKENRWRKLVVQMHT